MRLTITLDLPLAEVVVAAAERDRRRPGDQLVVLAEAELRRQGLIAPAPALATSAHRGLLDE